MVWLILFSLILAIVVIALLGWHYKAHFPALWEEISALCEQDGWPRRWLALALIPLAGRWIYQRVSQHTESWPRLIVNDPQPEEFLATELHSCEWILFGEQREQRSGDHSGTTFYPLDPNQVYSFVPVHTEINLEPHQIPITLPYSPVESPAPWAHLQFSEIDDVWRIHNISAGRCVIPVYQPISRDDFDQTTFRYISHHAPQVTKLNRGEHFVVGFSEFQIVRLPNLGIIRQDGIKELSVQLPAPEPIWIGHKERGFRKLPDDGVSHPRHIKIFKNKIEYINGEIWIGSYSSPQPERVGKGFLNRELNPGDKFYINQDTKTPIYLVSYFD